MACFPHNLCHVAEETLVVSLDEKTRQLMEVFQATAGSLSACDDWVVFIGPEGGYQMIAGYGGSLESLSWVKGASRAWRLTRGEGKLTVTGLSRTSRCELSAPSPQPTHRSLLSQSALYDLA